MGDRDREVAICLDEIDSAYDRIAARPLTKYQMSLMKSWVRKQKQRLVELSYLVPIRRRPRGRLKPDDPVETEE